MWDQKEFCAWSLWCFVRSHHGAEICELVGLFILNELIDDKKIDKANCGLYREDGLFIITKRSTRIIVQRVDYLDITMDLENDEYLPFRKENAKNIYMNFNSNHPCLIKK